MKPKDVLTELNNHTMTLEEVEDFFDQVMDDEESTNLPAMLGLSEQEMTAYAHGVGLKTLAQAREQSWPTSCAYCTKPISPSQFGWKAFEIKGELCLVHINHCLERYEVPPAPPRENQTAEAKKKREALMRTIEELLPIPQEGSVSKGYIRHLLKLLDALYLVADLSCVPSLLDMLTTETSQPLNHFIINLLESLVPQELSLEDFCKVLLEAIQQGSMGARRWSVFMLERAKRKQDLYLLLEWAVSEPELIVRLEAIDALAMRGSKEALPILTHLMNNDTEETVRTCAKQAIFYILHPEER